MLDICYKFYGKEIAGTHRYLSKDGNDLALVQENCDFLKAAVKKDFQCDVELSILHQIHSDIIINVDETNEIHRKADGHFTKRNNVALAIFTADCAPIMFYDRENQLIAACHSGWKGAFQEISAKLIERMIKEGANLHNIQVILGPMIRQESYEISQDFYENFITQNNDNEKFFINSTKKDHYMFDLPSYVKDNIIKNGIIENNIEDKGINTLTNEATLYSYRRSTLNNKTHSGNNVAIIFMK